MPKIVNIRFYEELNDFLPKKKRKVAFQQSLFTGQTVKDIIESVGIPHTAIDLILVNSFSVNFKYKPGNGDFISVYPVFESFDISNVTHLRPEPLRDTKFIADVHLGKLARNLRMCGFDTLYENDYSDSDVVRISVSEKRIILTRDMGILKTGRVTHGYFVRSEIPDEQLSEVISYFQLSGKIKPLVRCLECNEIIEKIEKQEVIHLLEPNTKKFFNEFYRCPGCKRIYWKGSHYDKMVNKIKI